MEKDKTINIQGTDIIEDLGLEGFSDEKKEKIIEKIGDVLHKRILLRFLKELSDQDAKKINELIKQNKLQLAYSCVEEKNPNFYKIVEEEIRDFKNELVQRLED